MRHRGLGVPVPNWRPAVSVERVMSGQQVRRVPVVDNHDRVIGIIAQADLAREQRAIGTKDFSKVVEKISEPAR